MGLLDSVIGALGQPQGGGQGNVLGALVGMLGQGGTGGAGGAGVLAGLVEKFHQGGLSEAVNSWVGTGQNLPVSADQVTQALGHDTIGQIAQQLGLQHGDVAAQLAQLLPQFIDKLTPNGQLPQGGLGDLAGMLGGMLGKR